MLNLTIKTVVMQKKKLIKRIILVVVIVALGYGINYCRKSFPIISGYGAKNMCSAIFVAHRNEQQVREQELGFAAMKLGTFTVDYKDSSVTGSVFGFCKYKAIYRKGLGATLVSEMPEDELRKQSFNLSQPPAINQDTVAWPMGDKVADEFPAAVNKAKLMEAVNAAFIESDTAKPIRTRAVIVLYDGKIIAEQYAPTFTKNTKLLGWSMTKSVTGALVGILARDGRLNINDPAPVPEWKDNTDPRHAITTKDLLQQSSGLDFEENYAKSCDATKMLFQRADMGGYTAEHPLKDKPGTVFYYSSGNSNILSRMVRQIVGDNGYYKFVYDSLFYKLGMYNSTIEPDESGTYVGSSYMYATARDWARFGLLYYNKGLYNGQRILTEEWVKQSAEVAPASDKGEYGYQFWLNAGPKGKESERECPNSPTDMYFADGYEGQRVFIIPSKKLVIVRLGLTQHKNFKQDAFVSSIVAAVN